MLFKTAKSIINSIEEFTDAIEQSILVFRSGVHDYLLKDTANFKFNFDKLDHLEARADKLRRSIEKELLSRALLPSHHAEIFRLIDQMDDLADKAKENLGQFEAEIPLIPDDLVNDLIRLTETSVKAAEMVIPACRAIFIDPNNVKEKLNKVYYYEKETDKLAIEFKRKVFHQEGELKLSEKFHLRYFSLHIESISDIAEKIADLLTVMAIKFRV